MERIVNVKTCINEVLATMDNCEPKDGRHRRKWRRHYDFLLDFKARYDDIRNQCHPRFNMELSNKIKELRDINGLYNMSVDDLILLI